METYRATLLNNQINWLGIMPKEFKTTKSYNVEIKIMEDELDSAPKNDLVEFFKNSPFYGVELDLERVKDYGRDIEL